MSYTGVTSELDHAIERLQEARRQLTRQSNSYDLLEGVKFFIQGQVLLNAAAKKLVLEAEPDDVLRICRIFQL